MYQRRQARFAQQREQILEELRMLEGQWNNILQALPPDKEQAEALIKKLNEAIVAKDNELADLDAEVSKLASLTNQDMKAVIVRGNAYEGSLIVINTVKYVLPSHVSRVVFKLRNKNVVMVKL